MNYFVLIFCLGFIDISLAYPRVIQVQNQADGQAIGDQVEILVDDSNELDSQELRNSNFDTQWQQSTMLVPNFGISESSYWFRFRLDIPDSINDEVLLVIGYPLLDSIRLYRQEADGRIELMAQTGDQYHFKNRYINYRNPVLKIPSHQANGPVTYYLEVNSSGAVQVPITLWTGKRFSEMRVQETFGYGFYYGLALVMILYNFCLYIATRYHIYAFYSAYIGAFLLAQMGLNGFSFMLLWPNSPAWSNGSLTFFMILTMLLLSLFTNAFLNLKSSSPRLHLVLKVLMSLQFLGLTASIFIPYRWSAKSIAVLVLATGITFLICAVHTIRIGYRPGRFFIVAFGVFILGCIILALKNLGVVPAIFITEHGMQIGSALEIVLLSLAMGDKIRLHEIESNEKISSLNESLVKLNQDLLDKDHAKTLFFQNTSHEFRTPLNGIIGFSELLLSGSYGQINPEAGSSVTKIKSLAMNLKKLIDNILKLASSNNNELSLEPSQFLLGGMIDSIDALREGLKVQFPESDLSIVRNFDEAASFTQDMEKIYTIIQNLVANALKFRKPGTQNLVTLTIQLGGEDANILELSVEDQGIGISKDDQDLIFEEFKQVDSESSRSYEGTGLGLPLSKAFVKLMGGQISLESEPNVGTCFRVSIPAYTGTPDAVKICSVSPRETLRLETFNDELDKEEELPQETAEDLEENKSYNLLVVDDNRINVEVLSKILEGRKYLVRKAFGGKEAIKLIKERAPDLLLLDLMMPETSGEDVLKWLRNDPEFAAIPVIILTARASDHDRALNLSFGADDYLAKPINSSELIYRVRNILQRQSQAMDRGRIQQLLESDKLISLGTMAAGLAHEINNPLAIITGNTYNLKKALKKVEFEGEYVYKSLDRIEHVCDRIANIISGLRTYSRDASNDPFTPNSIHSIIEDTLSLCRSRIRDSHVKLHYAQSETPVMINCHPSEICQVLFNLINNSLDEIEHKENAWIRIEVFRSNLSVEIRVIDSGLGIDKKIATEIFNPFFTLKEVGKGTGLGLSISKSICTNHSGNLRIDDSCPNTCFVISLPLESKDNQEHHNTTA